MADREVAHLFNELYETALYERRIALDHSMERAMNDLASRGMGGSSGAVVQQYIDLTRGELRARSALAWEKVQEVLSNLGFDPQLQSSRDVKELLTDAVDSQWAELSSQLSKRVQRINPKWQVPELASDVSNIKRELNAQVDLLLARLARQRPEGSTGQIFNFHSQVGAVQTGSHAMANLTLSLSPSGIEQLKQALVEVRSAAAAAPELLPTVSAEIVEIVDDITHELSVENPNKLRISNLATGIATAIQTIGSLQAAYATLKVALNFIGVQLP